MKLVADLLALKGTFLIFYPNVPTPQGTELGPRTNGGVPTDTLHDPGGISGLWQLTRREASPGSKLNLEE